MVPDKNGVPMPIYKFMLHSGQVFTGEGYLLHRPEPLEQVIGRLAGDRQVAAG